MALPAALSSALPVPYLEVPPCASGRRALATNWSLTDIPSSRGFAAPTQKSHVALCYDGEGWYLHAELKDNHPDSNSTHCGSNVWEGGAVFEFFAAPVQHRSDAPTWYHEADSSAAGAMWVGHIHNL